MGLGRAPGQQKAADLPYPIGTPAELTEMGENIADVPSCAIPGPGVKGCMFAGRCSKFFGRAKLGGFGPPSQAPGTPGQGPENVPYSIETAEGDEKEDFIPCHTFVNVLLPRMVASRVPDDMTGETSGEKIRILGVAGKAQIVVHDYLPVEPRTCNKTGNIAMKSDVRVMTVPKATRPKELDPRWKLRRARAEQDADAALDDMLDESAAPYMTASESDMADLAEAELTGDGLSQPAATSEPLKRRGK